MPQDITVGYRKLVDDALERIETVSPAEAIAMLTRDDVVFVDIRDVRELSRSGRIPGAIHAPRGMLEFWIDPASPYHKPVFAEDKKFVFFCAGGWRSALAALTAQTMGMKPVCHIDGGFGGWEKAGGPIDKPEMAPGEKRA